NRRGFRRAITVFNTVIPSRPQTRASAEGTSEESAFVLMARDSGFLIASRFGMTRVMNMAYSVPDLTDYSAATLEKAAGDCIAACQAESAEVRSEADLKAYRDRWMARKNGMLTQINDLWLKGAPKEAKRDAGMRVNELKARITELVEAAHVSAGGADSL